jgi:cytidyltransferase-like protein
MKKFKKHTEQFYDGSDYRISQSLKNKYKISYKEDRSSEEYELYRVSKVLDSFNVLYWIDFGTLLGGARNHRLISYDNDIDISLLMNDITLYDITLKLSEEFYIIHYQDDYVCIYPKNNKKFGYSHIDLYAFYEIPDKKIIKSKIRGWGGLVYRSYFFDNMDLIRVGNYNLPCPRHLDDFLSQMYGSDYMIEKRNDHCHDAIKNPEKIKEETISVYINGVFDLFHIGHVNILKNAKNYFDKLVVGIHSDFDVSSYKRTPIIPYNERLEILRSIKYIDYIIEDAPLYTDVDFLNKLDCKYMVYGKEDTDVINFNKDVPKNRIHEVKRTENISTSQLINKLNV